jgi:hypothetical protein
MKHVPGEKAALKMWIAPSREVWQEEGTEQVLPMVLVTFTMLKSRCGLTADVVYVVAGVVDMTTEVALTGPRKR